MTATVLPFEGAAKRPADPPADALIPEREVIVYRPCLAVSLLREARKAGMVAWTRGKRGTAWYTLEDVDSFLNTRKTPCHIQENMLSSSLAASGLPRSRGERGYIDIGLPPELEETAARALARKI